MNRIIDQIIWSNFEDIKISSGIWMNKSIDQIYDQYFFWKTATNDMTHFKSSGRYEKNNLPKLVVQQMNNKGNL